MQEMLLEHIPKNSDAIFHQDSGFDHNADRECARRLVAQHGERFRYVSGKKVWMVLADGIWRQDHHMNQMMLFAEDVADQLHLEYDSETDKERKANIWRLAKGGSTATGQKRMIARACLEPGVSADPSEFDSNPWLLGCRNGVLDLRNGQLREHRPDDYCTRQVPVSFDPQARSDVWDNFLETVQPNPETGLFLQRAAGYSLTGRTDEEALFVLHGPTSTGKSTLLGALRCALGEYAAMASLDTFLARARGGQIRSDIARLDGMRFVAASECNSGDVLDAAQVKAMTGGDIVVARYLRQDLFEFRPKCKIWMATNHRPLVAADDNAIWRRILEVPFTSQVCGAERSAAIKNQLQDVDLVGPAILRWAVEGCLAWQQRQLDPPEEVQAATRAYRDQMAALPEQTKGRDLRTAPPASPTSSSPARRSSEAQRTRRSPWEFRLSISGSLGRGGEK